MRITASVAGILLIAAVAVAQDDSIAVAPVAVVLDDAAIAGQVEAAKKHVNIGSIQKKVTTNAKTREKTQEVLVRSEQDMDSPFVGTMRLTVEMGDGDNIWYGQQQQTQKKKISKQPGVEQGKIDYAGEDSWTFKIALAADLKEARVKACAVEYGFMISNKFVVVAAKYDQMEGAEEIMARNQDSKNVIKINSSGNALKKGAGSGGGD